MERRGSRSRMSLKWDCYLKGRRDEVVKEDGISTVYFLEFSERMKAIQILNLFVVHGELKEVVIPPKRNKFGKRFGFARFIGVDHCRMLAIKLDSIFINSKKIYVNIHRFNRKE